MNETIKHQLNHRTFRKYIADKEVPQETVDLLIDVALQTAFICICKLGIIRGRILIKTKY